VVIEARHRSNSRERAKPEKRRLSSPAIVSQPKSQTSGETALAAVKTLPAATGF
jgi:hypothetical protein